METILTQYSIVCQVLGAAPYTICAYNGIDLSQVLGITQANLPEGHYGWIRVQKRGIYDILMVCVLTCFSVWRSIISTPPENSDIINTKAILPLITAISYSYYFARMM